MLEPALFDRDPPSGALQDPTPGSDGAAAREPGEALLSIEEACHRAAAYALPALGTEEVPLTRAVGRSLAADFVARRACPPFDQSAMDGYAVSAGMGVPAGASLHVAGRIAAGEVGHPLQPGEAVRIFTGAPMPIGADSVVMQEHVGRANGSIVLGAPVRAGEHLRRRGEDVVPGEVLVRAGQRLDARHIALLAAQGAASLKVARRPRLAIISTGRSFARRPTANWTRHPSTIRTGRCWSAWPWERVWT